MSKFILKKLDTSLWSTLSRINTRNKLYVILYLIYDKRLR